MELYSVTINVIVTHFMSRDATADVSSRNRKAALAAAPSMSSRLSHLALLFALFALANAQFQFFNEMFGQQRQNQQQPSGGQQWAMHAESRTWPLPHCYVNKLNYSLLVIVSCSDYLCQDSLVCVQRTIDCPCPVVQDVKCIVPDAQEAGSGTRLCIRGGTDCAQVEKLVNKFAK
jgi:hypothetical protein